MFFVILYAFLGKLEGDRIYSDFSGFIRAFFEPSSPSWDPTARNGLCQATYCRENGPQRAQTIYLDFSGILLIFADLSGHFSNHPAHPGSYRPKWPMSGHILSGERSTTGSNNISWFSGILSWLLSRSTALPPSAGVPSTSNWNPDDVITLSGHAGPAAIIYSLFRPFLHPKQK